MIASSARRLIGLAAAVLVLAFAILVTSGNDSAQAESGDYNATLTAFNCNSSWPPGDPYSCTSPVFTPDATSNTSTFLSIPANNLNFSLLVTFIPQDSVVAAAAAVPEAAMMGALRSGTTLGIANATCSPAKGLNVDFAFMNASIDDSAANLLDPTTIAAAPEEGTLEPYRDDDAAGGAATAGDGIPNHVQAYPSYIKALLDPDLTSLGADGLLDESGGGSDDTNGGLPAICFNHFMAQAGELGLDNPP